ncbi:MAG TPA: 2-oxoacid:ferredoxin oxidoreductase subunit beta [Rectinema sp.]|jgi:2-oxoglutarate ferredoxin oxidoreductase subunit beta|nr:2-oxoacid:ferredoxin oxidoreductase subunit beta [Rectinema sp.]HQE68827.1 2-oxoacid:ferredoxin oxidoreductase subunit beta [Rectinema sp.]HQH95209.1 2-oxoacid:ferredoxin oxidoreductase subunit beta [Rectinema sp.]HRT39188.1 2-oxoacid:ferredoxin oxidoreductase subunit beta [Rectinema sp.]HRU03765.1 2-oxoacid:ferredoxin oxidoreductase subunit beta [Rectinema sp.]
MAEFLSYFRQDRLPHIWCPGCGNGTVTGALVRAIDKLGLDKNNMVIVSGIGCSSRSVGYLDFDTLHTTHGRAIAFATGVKLANPELKVLVITGDGDCAAIGGNHFIHAARRNIDITAIIINNDTYGMTNGQASPMTPRGMFGTTAPYGNIEYNFDLCELAKAAGATYVARATTYHYVLLEDLIAKAIMHKGFSVVEALSQCPTYFGRKNKIGGAVETLNWIKDQTINIKAAASLPQEKREGKILIGELYKSEKAEFTEQYLELIGRLQKANPSYIRNEGEPGCELNSD